MDDKIKFIGKRRKNEEKINIDFLNYEEVNKIIKFHKSFPQYKKTPLVELKNLAEKYKVKDIYVKDESYRFGLNAFKVLGGSYAIGRYIAKKLGKDISEITFDYLISDEVKNKLGDITFITATDGNHGRGVAWTANQLKQKCIVYMPKGSAKERVENIALEGAEVTVQDLNYDECVRLADENAKKNGWVMIQDTAWDGYEDIPKWIMQGYMTMAFESYEDLKQKNLKPSHVFLQAGVGSLAAAVTGFFSNIYKDEKPIITIVEPKNANCIFRSIEENKRICVDGDMQTIMAGLACGEPNTVGLKVLMSYAENFISVSDEIAAHGMRVLNAPLSGDVRIISGESGAAPFGTVMKILEDKSLSSIKEKLKIDEDSIILFFSTEGDTDKENFQNIVWNGKYPNL
ncbi:diaminopropionate ammonia-lyase [Peptoniphilus koenoeneniae]|uniref:Diaminopropionate ammonia-lyase n=1 Tax=Peptoniphilus koenoeneniae TaxID=507751 RepID=A0ABU0AVK1_9FIRM|nr:MULTISPECIES: diaminopropionate ammonia-lyase [Peptoniphilus]ERT59836.1 diaminopropionate ammonia-lyase [Peptoniphilus sp. BV3C26]MDQ0274837.1 diaminopropionate ammonia-lyase [Peptoniphilus koenoeneniae]